MIRFTRQFFPLCSSFSSLCYHTVTILSDPIDCNRLLCVCISPHLISAKGDCWGNMVPPCDRTEGQVQGGLWQLVGWSITVSWWQTMLCSGNLLSTNPSGVYFFYPSVSLCSPRHSFNLSFSSHVAGLLHPLLQSKLADLLTHECDFLSSHDP